MVGGNVPADVMRERKTKDAKGLYVSGEPERVMGLKGWLDYQAGQASHLAYQAKTDDTTHVFLCDYDEAYAGLKTDGLYLEVSGRKYEVLLIDDPMGLHEHLETLLRHVG